MQNVTNATILRSQPPCGVAQRHADGTVTLLRPHPHGSLGVEVEVPAKTADRWRLATGDVVCGPTEPVEPGTHLADSADPARLAPSERLTDIVSVNGLAADAAMERPHPRTRRTSLERTLPERWLRLAALPADHAGRAVDFAAPLGAGCMGVVTGPHGSGMTSALRTVASGVLVAAPDARVVALLLHPRTEEVTHWRRSLPGVQTVVCPAVDGTCAALHALRAAELVLEAAQRETELGRDVVLLVDTLTALWGAMLEAEEADAQEEADHASARRRVREWVDRAGCFARETALGPGLGGSLTLVGAVWTHDLDGEAEEEKELHPALRLLEHITPAVTWRLGLSAEVALRRLHPAIDLAACRSDHEARFLPAGLAESLGRARARLHGQTPWERREALAAAIAESSDLDEMVTALAGDAEPEPRDLGDAWEALVRRHRAGDA